MPTATDQFFKEYATAYDNDSAEDVVSLYHTPAVLISEDSKKVYSSRDELVSYFENLMMELQTLDIVRHEARVMQLMKLSESIIFTNVTWTFINPFEDVVFSCMVSYTLQKMKDEQLAIIIAVLDDEEKKLASLLT